LEGFCADCCKSTVYAGSGMSVIGALVMASLQLNDAVEIAEPADCYVETVELLASCTNMKRYRCVLFRVVLA